ncbi:TRAP transporter permease [Marinobacterium rhizophilum]|uniref:TRAP transporter fused permease subunit n=1 Tax=Marinobacterium rhizophilum TaxID=420402 RepID=A0ABY5HJ72_9GAMM|nr:TRAP transporter fused permease subunit [Marinobacterium rhizophilum]UTW12417.1 TRAP transporter fused permease subunit [Marinobacterium rhizophilum]
MRTIKAVTLVIGFGLALQALYSAYAGGWEPTVHRSLALAFSAALIVLLKPFALEPFMRHGWLKALGYLFDILLFGIIAAAIYLLIEKAADVDSLLVSFSIEEQWLALLAVLALFELTRRVFGLPLLLVSSFSLVYCLYGAYMPWVFSHSGFSLEQSVETIWYGLQGVFGFPTGVVVQLIFVFIVFGVVLERSGAGDSLIRIAFYLTGHTRGGAGHAAIVASALFGSMSGSVTANVAGTGSFTIPMIKRRGFSPAFAGAVEGAASSGGQIMPPVMGAAVFLMADLTATPYLTICLAALIPALFYYGNLFLMVTLEARKAGIQPLPPEQRQRLDKGDWINAIMFIGPILTIIAVLLLGRSPAMAGFWATIAAVVLGFINPAVRRKPAILLEAMAQGGIAGAKILVAVASIGVILAVLNLTGFGLKFALLVQSLGGDSLFIGLVLMAVACLALGMGMPTLPAYLIIVLVMGKTMTNLGLEPLAIHMFVFYFGIMSALTPPVALAAFTAAPIAGANPMATAFVSMKLAFVGFVIPFVFVYNPELLLLGDFSVQSLLWIAARLLLAIWLLGSGLVGYLSAPLGIWVRVAHLLAGTLLLLDDPLWQGLGLAAALLLLARGMIIARRPEVAGQVL